MNSKAIKLILFVTPLIIFVLVIRSYQKVEFSELRRTAESKLGVNLCPTTDSKIDHVKTRDFMSYECKSMIRIGGPSGNIQNSPHPLYRIDGAWFICLDGQLGPKKDDCNVLSFGINNDYSFDLEMNRDFGCSVFSFDPIVEADIFSKIRSSNNNLAQSVQIKVNPKWTFYKYIHSLYISNKPSIITTLMFLD